jgi:uncharacterized protein YbjT (DUF2867 family)
MRVLVCGADGFLGRHLSAALAECGHVVVRGVHHPRLAGDIAIDYRADNDASTWLPRLAGIDAVVNAIGVLRELNPGDFEAIHHRAPAALFEACGRAGIGRVVQISALGRVATPYLTTKRAADQSLLAHVPTGTVLRPGLVFGSDGASTRFFTMLASLPVVGVLRGAGDVQPVHVDDVVAAVIAGLDRAAAGRIVDLPGPERLSFGDWLANFRRLMGLPPPIRLPVPAFLTTMAAAVLDHVPGAMLSRDNWAMLRAGNTGDAAAARELLGRPLRRPADFAPGVEGELLRHRALAAWRRPLTLLVLAFLWIASAVLSAGLYPVAGSLALLAPYGLHGSAAVAVLAGASALDLVMGILTLWRPGPRLWLAQLILIAAYSLLIAVAWPGFLLHPFAPVLKNLAIVVLLVQLWAEERAP